MPKGRGRLPAAFCALLLALALPLGEVQAADSAPAGGSASAPFGELPDMQALADALEIIGNTPLDGLSQSQREALYAIGMDPDTLKENEALLNEVRANLPEEGPHPALWAGGAAAAAAAAGTGVWYAVRKKRRK